MTTTDSQIQPPAPGRARPIVLYLVVLALVAFVPVMAFSAVLLQRNNEAQQEVVQTLILATTDAVSEAVDRQIDGMTTTLKGFASAPMATEDDLRQLHARGQSVLEGTGTFLTLIGADDHALFNTRFPYGTPMSGGPNTAAIGKAIATQQTIVADVTYGPVAKAWVLPIFMPVTLPDGRAAVLGITQNAQTIGILLLTRQMPDGWRVALVDTRNDVIASSPIADIAPGTAFFVPPDPRADGQHGWRHVMADDRQLVVVSSITKTGWRVVAWAPAAAVERPLSNSLLTLIVGGIVIVCRGDGRDLLSQPRNFTLRARSRT